MPQKWNKNEVFLFPPERPNTLLNLKLRADIKSEVEEPNAFIITKIIVVVRDHITVFDCLHGGLHYKTMQQLDY